jgi:hypothetical protein
MPTRQFWTGRRIFVVVDDITSWTMMDNPLLGLAEHVERAGEIGLHVLTTADIRSWSQHSQGLGAPGALGASPTGSSSTSSAAASATTDVAAGPPVRARPAARAFPARAGWRPARFEMPDHLARRWELSA